MIANNLLTDSPYKDFISKRYESFDTGFGRDFEKGKIELQDLYEIAKKNGELKLKSGKQEFLENLLFNYIK